MLRKIYHLLPKSYSDAIPKYTSRLNLSISQSINQSVKIYIAPSQDTYSEELPTQVKRKTTVLRRWWNWEQAPFGGALDLLEVHSRFFDQPQKMNESALSQSGRM